MFERKKRQLIIISIYAIVAIVIGIGLYDLFTDDPTCFDGKKNQSEKGIDCGGQCAACEKELQVAPIAIEETAVVEGTNGRYDALVRLKNPNNLHGASGFEYTITLTDDQGVALTEETGTSFILPFETKSIILEALEVSSKPTQVKIDITDVEWIEFRDYSEPQLRFVRKEYKPITSGPGFGEVYGLLRNDSTLDFHTINIKIVLRDEKNDVIALTTTQMNTVKSSEERDFFIKYPERFDGFVSKVEAEAEADVLNSENYIRLYLPGGRFQDH